MERKIGEIFEYDGEWYQCVKSSDCPKCDLKHLHNCNHHFHCSTLTRKDGEEVIFKKLEKIEKPYNVLIQGEWKCFQRYHTYTKPLYHGSLLTWTTGGYNFIDIENNQIDKDMEEKKLNIKPFDLEAAKSGKPVCTRDGRKAIFLTTLSNKNFPVVAIVNHGQEENVYQYDINGIYDEYDDNLDLMMLPEKKEGWINVYKGNNGISKYDCDDIVFNTKEEAIQYAQEDNKYITTVKIEWEE